MKTLRTIFLALITVFIFSGLKAQEIKYEFFFSKTVSGSFDEVIEKVITKFKKIGFELVTEIDLDKNLKEELDVKIEPYKILGICNPEFSYRALQAEPNIGVFLPCKIIVKQLDEKHIEVVSLNPILFMNMLNNEEISKMAEEIAIKMKTVIENL